MAKHGTIGPFRGDANNWSAYTESLEQYFVANDVTEDAKSERFCSVLVTPTYKLIRKLVSPQKPSEVEYD